MITEYTLLHQSSEPSQTVFVFVVRLLVPGFRAVTLGVHVVTGSALAVVATVVAHAPGDAVGELGAREIGVTILTDAIARHLLESTGAIIVVVFFVFVFGQTTTHGLGHGGLSERGHEVDVASGPGTGRVNQEGCRHGLLVDELFAVEFEHARVTVVTEQSLVVVEDDLIGVQIHVAGQDGLIVFFAANVGLGDDIDQISRTADHQTGIQVDVLAVFSRVFLGEIRRRSTCSHSCQKNTTGCCGCHRP
jgi:hypothetical protein